MKRLLFVVAMATLLISLLIPNLVAANGNVGTQPVRTGTVNAPGSYAWVRSGPGTTYRPVGSLSHGAAVTVLETVPGPSVYGGPAQWYRIGAGRYIYSGLIKLSSLPVIDPSKPPVSNSGKWIEIILSSHALIAWNGNTPVLTTLVATGKRSTPTVTGTFRVYAKYPFKNMSGADYYQPRVPDTMFFYGGYAIHGCYWHNNFGQSVSHGCVNLNLKDAHWLYDWTPMGTKVVIHN